jgi:hypothetical protein
MDVMDNTFYQYVVKRKDDIIMQWVVKNVLMKTGLKIIVIGVGKRMFQWNESAAEEFPEEYARECAKYIAL